MIKYLVPEGKHLPYTDENGKPDHRLMGAAWAALHGGYRGNKYEGPDKDKAIAKLRGVYKSEGMTPPGDETQAGNAILCRARVQLAPTLTGEMLFMPEGRHDIMPFSGGVGKPIKILVDHNAAQEIEQQRSELAAKGKPVYFDFDHKDEGASFWAKEFVWKDGQGIIAKGDWTTRGKSSVEGKEYRYFSPVFYVDNKHGDPALIQCRTEARANMGALINDPAFHEISPLWAKSAGDNGDADNNKKGEIEMTPEEIAELRAKQAEIEEKVKALEEKGEPSDTFKSEADKIEAQLALAREQEKNAVLAAAVKERAEADARHEIK